MKVNFCHQFKFEFFQLKFLASKSDFEFEKKKEEKQPQKTRNHPNNQGGGIKPWITSLNIQAVNLPLVM